MNLLNVLLIIGVVLPSVAYLILSFLIMRDQGSDMFAEIFPIFILIPSLCLLLAPYTGAVFIPAMVLLIVLVHTKMNSELWYYRIMKPLFIWGNVLYLCCAVINVISGGKAF